MLHTDPHLGSEHEYIYKKKREMKDKIFEERHAVLYGTAAGQNFYGSESSDPDSFFDFFFPGIKKKLSG
jgi:hypothetical protein